MNPFDIFITRLSWGSGSKNRPVLALMIKADTILIYPITTQYENKSKVIRARLFKMIDWKQAGLGRQSYINTETIIKIPVSAIKNRKPIEQLTIADKQRSLDFLSW